MRYLISKLHDTQRSSIEENLVETKAISKLLKYCQKEKNLASNFRRINSVAARGTNLAEREVFVYNSTKPFKNSSISFIKPLNNFSLVYVNN